MEKSETGFLESIYRGSFTAAPAYGSLPSRTDAVKGFLARFREAMAGFDQRNIEEGHRIPPELMQRLKEIGMFGLIMGREYGGLGLSIPEYLAVIEGLSESDMALTLVPMAHLSIGVMGLLLFGSEEQKSRYLPRAASGETIFAYALTEPETGSDAQHIRTAATPGGDGSYILQGTKTYITNANYAGAFSVFARVGEEGMGMFVVERGWDGVIVGPDMPKMGLAVSSTASVRLKSVRVPRENLVGGPADGFKIAMTILNYGRLGLGAASVGLLSRSLADMAKRSAERRQFGVPIRGFELIQEKLVHARVHGFAVSAMTSFTAALLSRNPLRNVALESSHCKLYGTTRCWDTLYDAQQTAGGAGYLATLPYEKRLRDFRVTTIFEGTTEIHSFYPPLALFRWYGKELQAIGVLGKLRLLGRIRRARGLRHGAAGERNPVLKRALLTAARGEALFRQFLSHGLRSYGKDIAAEEFFLRRMNNISLSLFWLIASVWKVKGEHPDEEYPRELLDIVAYLTEETRQVQRRDGRVEKSRAEIIHHRIVKAI